MTIHIIDKINKPTYYYAFIGTLEKEFRYVKGKIFSDLLTKPEVKAIQEYFNNLKITVNELRTN